MKTKVNNPTHLKSTSLEPSMSIEELKTIEEAHLDGLAFELSEFKSDLAHLQCNNRKIDPTIGTTIKLLLAKFDDMGNTKMYSANYDEYYENALYSMSLNELDPND